MLNDDNSVVLVAFQLSKPLLVSKRPFRILAAGTDMPNGMTAGASHAKLLQLAVLEPLVEGCFPSISDRRG